MGATYGETNWKAEDEYRQGIREFSETGGSPTGARERGSERSAGTEERGEGSSSGNRRGQEGEAEEESEW